MFHRLSIAAALAIALAAPQAARAANVTATVNAKIVKPLVLTGGQTIGLGTIVTPSTATFSGTFTVQPAATQTGTYCQAAFACAGTPTAAMFNIQGQNNTPLNIAIPLTVTLTATDYSGAGAAPTLTMATSNSLFANNSSGTYTMTLPNSGAPGINFYVGGAITVNQATAGGTYAGTIAITADYQ